MVWTDRIAERREIGVVVERHALQNRWATHRWHPGGVLLEVPDAAPWTKLGGEGAVERYYAGSASITLVPSESESYLYNLNSRAPHLWVVLRPCAPQADGRDIELESVTASAGEAEVLAGGAELVVESIPLPFELVRWMADFVAQHPSAPPAFKRKRSAHVSEGKALEERLKAGLDDE
jgi:hypothetical protein